MSIAIPKLRHEPSVSQAKSIPFNYLSIIFETLLESLFPSHGLMLLDEKGDLLQISPKARELFNLLGVGKPTTQVEHAYKGSDSALPPEIQALYQSMVDSQCVFADQRIQLNEDIFIDGSVRIHLNAEWIQLGLEDPQHILITIEDLTEVSRQRALFDTYRYNLTFREMEVWELHLQGLSYRQISEKLFITVNTVKKHMKTIHSKRRFEQLNR